MKPEIRVKRLFNQVKRKFGIKDKINLKIIKKEQKKKGGPFMEIDLNPKIPIIFTYTNSSIFRFERMYDKRLKHCLAHELVHYLIDKNRKEKDPKQLRKVLKLINKMIDHR